MDAKLYYSTGPGQSLQKVGTVLALSNAPGSPCPGCVETLNAIAKAVPFPLIVTSWGNTRDGRPTHKRCCTLDLRRKGLTGREETTLRKALHPYVSGRVLRLGPPEYAPHYHVELREAVPRYDPALLRRLRRITQE